MKICVYTVILGRYDALLDPTEGSAAGAEFICFTDDPTLSSDVWDIRLVEPSFPTDIVRSARMLKILGHESLSEYDVTVYMDASVRLRTPPGQLVSAWLESDHDMALANHSFRAHLVDEFDEVVRLNYDDRGRIYEQLVDYATFTPDLLLERPVWTGILIRRSTPAVASAMRIWADHVLRYSRRDQLSILVALHGSDLRYRALDVDNFESEFHLWPVLDNRRIAAGKAPASPSGPLVAELHRAKADIVRLHARIDSLGAQTIDELTVTTENLRAQIEEGTRERERLERQIDDCKRLAGVYEERLRAVSGIEGAISNLRRALTRRFRRGE